MFVFLVSLTLFRCLLAIEQNGTVLFCSIIVFALHCQEILSVYARVCHASLLRLTDSRLVMTNVIKKKTTDVNRHTPCKKVSKEEMIKQNLNPMCISLKAFTEFQAGDYM